MQKVHRDDGDVNINKQNGSAVYVYRRRKLPAMEML